MQQVAGWGLINWADPVQSMLLSRSSHYNLITQIESRSFIYATQSPTLVLIHKVWQEVRRIMQYENISTYALIWGNTNYPELCKLEMFESWSAVGIHYIAQLYKDNTFRTFHYLRTMYPLPSHAFFYIYSCDMLCSLSLKIKNLRYRICHL